MKPLIEQLPRHYQTSQQDAELQRALTVLLTQVQADLDFTMKQLIPSTASGWGGLRYPVPGRSGRGPAEEPGAGQAPGHGHNHGA